MKFRFNKCKFFILIFLAFVFNSCTNIYETGNEKQSVIQEQGKLTVSAQADYYNARSAIPSAMPSGTVYFATLSYVDGGTTKYLGQKVKNISETTSLCFTYDIPTFAESKQCTLTVYAFASGTTEFSENYIASGSAKQTIAKGQMISNFGTINLTLKTENTTTKGTVELGITNSSGGTLSIKSLSKGGTSLTVSEYFIYDSSNNKLTSASGGIAPGVYTITFKAVSGSDSIELENPVQIINVAAGMKTDEWLVNGAQLSDLIINKITYTTFYVCGSNPVFYGTGGTSGLNVSGESSNSGSLISPKATVAQTVALCTDTTKSYTIYVDGTTSESSGITINANTTIKALSTGAELLRSGTSGSMITVSSGKELTLEGIKIDGDSNEVAANGAGIFNYGTLILIDSVITKCKTTEYGGAIYSSPNTNVYLYGNTTVSYNTASYGGAISIGSESSGPAILVIGEDKNTDSVKINNNIADHLGGAIIAKGGAKITMNSGSIFDNTAGTESNTNSRGGALYLWGDANYTSTFTMNGGSIYGNKAVSSDNTGYGGAVCIDDGGGKRSSFIMTGGELYLNTAYLGQAIYHAAGNTDNGQLKLSGYALIKADNDIYLGSNKFITITGNLNPKDENGDEPRYTAYITPESVTVGTTVLIEASARLVASNYKKFKVSTSDWCIESNGKLNDIIPIESLSSAPSSGTSVFAETADEMVKLAEWVNSGSSLSGVTIILNDNITLPEDFIPIGGTNYNSSNKFAGTFNGNDKTITIQKNGDTAIDAMFGSTKTGAIIKSLTVEGETSSAGLVKYMFGGTIENCTSKVTVNSTTDHCAGLVYNLYSSGCTIKNCINEGSVTTTRGRASGITAWASSDCEINGCINKGSINASGSAGGIVGYSQGSSSLKIRNCINYGPIEGSTAGGIVAFNNGARYIENNLNYGIITGSSKVGGICGAIDDGSSELHNNVHAGSLILTSSSTKYGYVTAEERLESGNETTYFVINTYNYGLSNSAKYNDTSQTDNFYNLGSPYSTHRDTKRENNYSFTVRGSSYTTPEEIMVNYSQTSNLVSILNDWLADYTETYYYWYIDDNNKLFIRATE